MRWVRPLGPHGTPGTPVVLVVLVVLGVLFGASHVLPGPLHPAPTFGGAGTHPGGLHHHHADGSDVEEEQAPLLPGPEVGGPRSSRAGLGLCVGVPGVGTRPDVPTPVPLLA